MALPDGGSACVSASRGGEQACQIGIVAGHTKMRASDYSCIIIDVARKIPEKILQEDPKLLMWYDQALTRTEED